MMIESQYTEQEVHDLSARANSEGSASFTLSRAECALLVIDMQDEFIKPNLTPFWVPEATRQVPRIKSLIEHCRAREVPAIFTAFAITHQYHDRLVSGAFMPNRYPTLSTQESPFFKEGRIRNELAPLPDEIVIHKPSYGAYYDTPLETILRNLGRDTVIICGTLMNFCCGTTARQAYERGFKLRRRSYGKRRRQS